MKKLYTLIYLLGIIISTVSYADNPNLPFHSLENKPMQLTTLESPEHKVLREHAQAVKFPLDAATQNFIQEFREFFRTLESPFGKPAGLAAPQVGISKQIIIIQIPPEAKKVRKDVYDVVPPTILINPSYVPVPEDGKSKDWEGCFSVTDKMGEVYRYSAIRYEAYTSEGKKVIGLAKGFLARLIQHEVGHLNGELYIDLLCPDCRHGAMAEMLEVRKHETSSSK
jgi:peptide deformylase